MRRQRVIAIVALATVLLLPAGASAKKKPPPPPPGPPTTSTYVKNYANVLNGVEYDLTPQDVQATSDGGWVALAVTQSANGIGAGWLLRANAVGAPQWAEEVGCFSGAPGDYADAVSFRQTSDGGYVLGGGAIGCNSTPICAYECGLVEKVDAGGRVLWAQAYSADVKETSIDQIEPTSDGGFVA